MVELNDLLIDFISLLPIEDDEVSKYVKRIVPSIEKNYELGHYQFSYFGVHLLFMTYIYCNVWQVYKLSNFRFLDAAIHATTYHGKEANIKFDDIKSVFDFSNVPEKNISKFLQLCNVNNGCIGRIKARINLRDKLAHASGSIDIDTQLDFDYEVKEIYKIIREIEKNFEQYVKNYYGEILKTFLVENKYLDYDEWENVLSEHLIMEQSFSTAQLKYCTNFGLTRIKSTIEPRLSKEQILKLNQLHNETGKVFSEYINQC